jgi:hypothetical protein
MRSLSILQVAIVTWVALVICPLAALEGGDEAKAIVLTEEDSGKSFVISEHASIVIQLKGESGSTGASFAAPSYDPSVLEFQGKSNKTPPGVQGRVGWSYWTSFTFRVKRPADTAIEIHLLYPGGPHRFDRHYVFYLKGN